MSVTAENLITITPEGAYAFLAKMIHDHLKANQIGQLGEHKKVRGLMTRLGFAAL